MISLTQNYSIKICLVIVLFGKFAKSNQVSVFKCSVFHGQWEQLIQNNLHYLCRTSEEIPLQCIYEVTDFRFPLEILEISNRDNAIIIYEILQQIFHLLSEAHSYHVWNSTCFENLQNVLHEQMEELSTCLNATEIQTEPSYLLTLKVKRYFQRMNCFLTVRQYSSCSWEMIRSEIKVCMMFITYLLKKLK